MYDDQTWTAMSGTERAALLKRIHPIDGKYRVSPGSTTVCWRSLPFYDSVRLVGVTDVGWPVPNLSVYYLTDGVDLYRLNGTSPPIHEVNERAPIGLTDENVLDYLRFFCWFVRSERGPFALVEQVRALRGDVDARTRMAARRAVRPARCEGADEQGNFLCEAVLCHAGELFRAQFEVQPNGMVLMVDDDLIAAGVPLMDMERIL